MASWANIVSKNIKVEKNKMSVNTKSTVQVATSSPTTTKKQTSKFKTPQKNLTIPILDQELTPSTIRKNPKNWASITKKHSN